MSLQDRLKRIEQRLSAVDAVAFEWAKRLIIEVPGHISSEQRDALIEALADAGVDKAIVLDGGMRIARPTDAQVAELRDSLVRVESKIDAMLDALASEDDDAEEEEEQAEGLDLDGNRFGCERDQTQTL